MSKVPESVQIHGKPTKVSWLMKIVLKWFGPFHTRVKTGLPCTEAGCKGELTHVYTVVECFDTPFHGVWTMTNDGNRKSMTWRQDSCTLPSCKLWGELVMHEVESDSDLGRAYKKQTRTWRYR